MIRGMVVLGLTGSIGMGKSTAAAMLRSLGVPVYEADQTVHQVLGPRGAAVPAVKKAFPDAVRKGIVDRNALADRVFGDQEALARLEAIIHPFVRQAARQFLTLAALRREKVVVLDVPLLFETGWDARCDATIVMTAPHHLQEARVLSRPGMTRARLAAVRARQVPDGEKRRRADFVVPTGLSRRLTVRELARIVRLVRRARRTGRPIRSTGEGWTH